MIIHLDVLYIFVDLLLSLMCNLIYSCNYLINSILDVSSIARFNYIICTVSVRLTIYIFFAVYYCKR